MRPLESAANNIRSGCQNTPLHISTQGRFYRRSVSGDEVLHTHDAIVEHDQRDCINPRVVT